MQTSLVDVAKSMGLNSSENATSLVETAKPTSLLDVARQEAVKPVRTSGVSLQRLAQEINEEERSRLQSAVAATAAEVQQESIAQRESSLMRAAAEIAQEEAQAAQVLVTKKQASVAVALLVAKEPSPVQTQQDDAGYSSYEDYEDDNRESSSNSSVRKQHEPEEVAPEKTTVNDSPECKLLLRAVFKADVRTVRDLLAADEDAAMFADQVRRSCACHSLHWIAHEALTAARLERPALGCVAGPQGDAGHSAAA